MTINEYNRAKELEALIEKSEQDSKCLRALIDRIEELSKNNSQFSSVNIQISEKWMNTPITKSSKDFKKRGIYVDSKTRWIFGKHRKVRNG